jgi:hypothetical protein
MGFRHQEDVYFLCVEKYFYIFYELGQSICIPRRFVVYVNYFSNLLTTVVRRFVGVLICSACLDKFISKLVKDCCIILISVFLVCFCCTNRNHKKCWETITGLTQAKGLIQGPSSRRTKDLLKLNRDQVRWVVVLLTGHCHLTNTFSNID